MSAVNAAMREQLDVTRDVLDAADRLGVEVSTVTLSQHGRIGVSLRRDADGPGVAHAIDANAPVRHFPASVYTAGYSVWHCRYRGQHVDVFGTVNEAVAS